MVNLKSWKGKFPHEHAWNESGCSVVWVNLSTFFFIGLWLDFKLYRKSVHVKKKG